MLMAAVEISPVRLIRGGRGSCLVNFAVYAAPLIRTGLADCAPARLAPAATGSTAAAPTAPLRFRKLLLFMCHRPLAPAFRAGGQQGRERPSVLCDPPRIRTGPGRRRRRPCRPGTSESCVSRLSL